MFWKAISGSIDNSPKLLSREVDWKKRFLNKTKEIKNRDIIKKFDLKLSNYPIDTSIAFIKLIDKLNLNIEDAYEFLKKKSTTEHRFEKVEIINGTRFINDSKSTNFHSVSSASERVNNALLIMHGIT